MDKNLPLISVIIPIHNAETYLEECVTSVLNQTYKNIEILLVDDNSTDGSRGIENRIAKSDSRVRLFQVSFGQAGKTRNFGLGEMLGDYLYFLDSDDKIHPEALQNLYEPLKGSECGFSISKFTTQQNRFEENGGSVEVKEVLGDFLSKVKGIQGAGYPSFSPCAKLYTRNIFEELRYPDIEIHEDTSLILPIVDRAKEIFLVDSIDYYYRVNATSITHSKISMKNDAIFIKNDLQIKFAKENHPAALNYIYQLCMNENDFVAMKCKFDGSNLALQLLEKLYKQNQCFSKKTGKRQVLYKSKIIYSFYLRISGFVWNNDFIRGLAKKILT